MFSRFNVLTFFILLFINIIPIYFSHKRRKFAYFSTKFFVIFFSCYWIFLLFYFQIFGLFNPATIGKTNNLGKNPSKYEATYASKSDYESEMNSQLRRLNVLIKLSLIQALIVILLSGFGILWLNEKVEYYIRVVCIFVLLFVFCCFILKNGTIMSGYEVAVH
jgi:hypothetical protein